MKLSRDLLDVATLRPWLLLSLAGCGFSLLMFAALEAAGVEDAGLGLATGWLLVILLWRIGR